jgi:hypothetical protein
MKSYSSKTLKHMKNGDLENGKIEVLQEYKMLLLTFAQWEDWSLDWTTIILLFSTVNSFPTIFSVFQPEKWIPEERNV